MTTSTGRLLQAGDGLRYRFDAGALCLDFLLSGGEGRYARWESLHRPADLGRFLAAGPVPAGGPPLPAELPADEDELAAARALRAAIRGLVDARIDGRAPAAADVAVLNRAAAGPTPVPVLDPTATARAWRTPVTGAEAVAMIARDAVALLGGPLGGRLRRCAAADCHLVFADTSRPGARRWCAMERCGNRDKQRRLTRRRREDDDGERGRAHMDVVVAGGHGKIGQRLLALLAGDGHRGRGLIRDPGQAGDLAALGAEAVVCDLEHAGPDEVAAAVDGADTIVFAAGAGPGSGPARKRTMDLGGVLALIDAARDRGVRRFVVVSSMGADAGAPDDGGFGTYLRAKGEADDAARASGLDVTAVRPGSLTDEPGTGRVRVGASLERGTVSRDDVAATLLAVLTTPATIGATFDLLAGDTPIPQALAALPTGPPTT